MMRLAADRPVLAARLQVRPKVVPVFVVHFERVNLHARRASLILHLLDLYFHKRRRIRRRHTGGC